MIAIGCDHAAIDYKEDIIAHLNGRGIAFKDFGAKSGEACDYPDYALEVAQSVVSGECEKGILICGTGIGMCIAANKVPGVRCALCTDTFSARATRQHNDANVLALGRRNTGIGVVLDVVDVFIDTPFSGEERHSRRIDKIRAVEKKYSK